tara:strand:+ start:57 stop:524 length:468 start_codon:yes stop_codon:yes gene_type:complete
MKLDDHSEWQYEDQMGRFGENPTLLTVVAKGLVTVGNMLFFVPSLLITGPVLLILTMMKQVVPGGVVLLLPFSLIWIVMVAMLIGTSWLWEKVPPLRLALIPVGVHLAWVGCVLVRTIPDDPEDRWAKHALADQWPLSFDLIRQLRERLGSDVDE